MFRPLLLPSSAKDGHANVKRRPAIFNMPGYTLNIFILLFLVYFGDNIHVAYAS